MTGKRGKMSYYKELKEKFLKRAMYWVISYQDDTFYDSDKELLEDLAYDLEKLSKQIRKALEE